MDEFDEVVVGLLPAHNGLVVDQLLELKVLSLDLLLVELDDGEALLQRHHIAALPQAEHIDHCAILQGVLQLLVGETVVGRREELHQIVAVDADAPVPVALHLEQMSRNVVVDDGLEQVGVEFAEVALLLKLLAAEEDEALSDEMALPGQQVQLQHVDLLVVAKVPHAH